MKTQTTASNEKKTVIVDAIVRVIAAGHNCCRGMAWESPYVIFQLGDFSEVIWHSEQVAEILGRFGIKHSYELKGKDFGVSMLVRGNRVWRVKRIYPLE